MFHTINVIWMFSQNVLVKLFCFVEFTHGLVEPGKVVGCCHRDGIVVMLIMLSLCFRAIQRRQEVFLRHRKERGMKHSRTGSKKNFCVTKKHHSNCEHTFASPRFPSLKCRAPTLFRISGGTSAWTFSCRMRVAVP